MALVYQQIDSNKRKSWLLVGGFIIVVTVIGWVFSRALDSPGLLIGASIFAVVYAFISYYYSDSMVLAASQAREVKKADAPELYRLVENLCITGGLPTPRVYVIDDTAPNAFATGRDPKHAVVAVTTGLLEKLDKAELEGVIAHELSHIGNYDIRLMSLVVVLVAVVALLSDWFLRMTFWGGGRDRDNDNSQLQAVLMVAGLVLAILAPIVGTMIQLAVSRRREYLADASGVLLTRYPDGLARALHKISQDTEPLEAANKATANLYIVNPLRENVQDARRYFARLFSTHPPIPERIRRLREMEGSV